MLSIAKQCRWFLGFLGFLGFSGFLASLRGCPQGEVRSQILRMVLCMLLGFTVLPCSAQQLPQAPGAEVIDLTPEPGYFTEPGIAVNPHNPEQVVAAFQDNAHAAYSSDGGRHWQVATGVESTSYRVSGDVSITFDNQGHAIICYMAFDKLGTFNYWAHNASRNGLFVRRSLDGGKTWEAKDIAILEHASEPGIPWEDKPFIVADNSHGPHAGNLYVGWTRWTLTDSEIVLSRSTDDGKTWSKPIEIDGHPGLPRDDNGAVEGFEGIVGPDGTLYVVWDDGNHIRFTSSHDGGETFSSARGIIDTAPIMFEVQDVARSNGFPQIAVGPAKGNPHGLLYVTWSDYRNGDIDVFCSTSPDGGRSWTPALRVNTDPVHNGADQFFQWLAVDPTDGSANLLFYDRRSASKNLEQIVVLARSTDGGRSFSNYAWTNKPFRAGGVFMGDYTGIAALGGRVYGIWTEKPLPPANPPDTSAEANLPSGKRSPEYWKAHGTIVRVGVASFPAAEASAQRSVATAPNPKASASRTSVPKTPGP